MRNLRIMVKLIFASIIVFAILAAAFAYSVSVTTQLRATYTGLLDVAAPAQAAALRLEADVWSLAAQAPAYAATGNADTFQSTLSDATAQMSFIAAHGRVAGVANTVRALQVDLGKALQSARRVTSLAGAGASAKTGSAISSLGIASHRTAQDAMRLVHSLARAESLAEARARASSAQSLRLEILFMGIAALIGLVLIVYMSRGIASPMARMAEAAAKIAEGDLRISELEAASRDEVGQVARAFNTMVQGLRSMLGRIGRASEDLTTSSERMAAAATHVAHATRPIAAAVQEVARGAAQQSAGAVDSVDVMRQLQDVIGQITQGAQTQAKDIAQTSATIRQTAQAIVRVARGAHEIWAAAALGLAAGEEGGQFVQETIRGMQAILEASQAATRQVHGLGESSEQIGQIIQVIDGIAEQTNLLALNAAIEAARAGENGKGFAVVAEEVRRLAEASTRATKEIAALIAAIQASVNATVAAMGESSRKVADGSERARAAGE
jgi:methyl-accepting chemotaxis protein